MTDKLPLHKKDVYEQHLYRDEKRKKLRRFFFLSLATAGAITVAIALGVVLPKILSRAKGKSETAAAEEKAANEAKKIEEARQFLNTDTNTQTNLSAPEPAPEPLVDLLGISFRPLKLPPEEQATKDKLVDQVIANFSAATTPEEKAAYVRNPERVLPLMRRYYTDEGNRSPYESEKAEEKSFLLVKGQEYASRKYSRNPTSINNPFIYLAHQGDNTFKIDWESMVGHSEMPWGEFLEKRPTQPTLFRCIVANGDFYNFSFSDPEKWVCFTLCRPYSLDTIYGYAEKGSEIEERLRKSLNLLPRLTAILRLSIPKDNKGKRLVRIDEMVQETWVVVPANPGA